jgi:hypothetical protein
MQYHDVLALRRYMNAQTLGDICRSDLPFCGAESELSMAEVSGITEAPPMNEHT